MDPSLRPPASAIVIFGAAGDLTWRKLVPALYNLFLDQWLPERFQVIGVDIKPMSDEDFKRRLRQGVNRFSRRGAVEASLWEAFASHLSFSAYNFSSPELYQDLTKRLDGLDQEWGARANRIYYLAIPPALVQPVVEQLGKAHLAVDREWERIVVEKPFGRDLASAQALNQFLTSIFDESQIFRIDHYLGKETVQDILAFRFANALFEPVWNRRYVDSVQITVAESIGVGHRAGYYEGAGALRDMVQNHLLQVMSLVAMEPPVSFHADQIRNKAVDVLHAVRQIRSEYAGQCAARGQYGVGWIEGEHVPAYRDEPGVSKYSSIETYAAVRLYIDNWRWQDVPFFLRTGKRLPERVSEVSILFRPIPHNLFPVSCLHDWQPNRLAVRIQPDEGILLRTHAKLPGPTMRLTTVDMSFSYRTAFKVAPPDAYENLLLDILRGDQTLFMRADQIEEAWGIITPVLDAWAKLPLDEQDIYPAGSWGPESANQLVAADRHHWLLPTVVEESHETPLPQQVLSEKPQ